VVDTLWPTDVDDPLSSAWDESVNAGGRDETLQAQTEWQEAPIAWIVSKLGVPEHTLRWALNPEYEGHAWDGDVDPLAEVADALVAWEDVGVESGTGTGKSFLLACLILWFVACWKGARVFTFAPKEDQLRLYIWSEIGKLWPRFQAMFPDAELTDLRIRMVEGTDEWGAWGYSVGLRAGEEVATKAAGMHAEHMLLVYEEMPGIPLPVVTAGENTATAPHNLRVGIGNPDHQADALHVFCTSPGVRHVRMSALDHPNVVCGRDVVPGAVSVKAVDRRRVKYGADSRLYLSRVCGISPTESEDALIRWSWCEAAAQRYQDERYRVGLPALGVDVANSENGDHAAIARWQGACLTEVVSFQCPDASILGVRVAGEMAPSPFDPASGVEARHVGVDSVGVGASTVNKLKELGKRIRALNGGSSANPGVDEDVRYRTHPDESTGEEGGPSVVESERYKNLRSQMWWQMREDLRMNRVAFPNDEDLFRDLTTPTFRTLGGKIIVESKETIRERLRRSPDKGDATVYGNWVRRRRPLPKSQTKPDRNVDTGLEKVLARHAEAQRGRYGPVKGLVRKSRPAVTPVTVEATPAPAPSAPAPTAQDFSAGIAALLAQVKP
jgi:hypothetical protein